MSKRSGIVLWLLLQTEGGSIENKDLVDKFGAWHLSRTHGASRDVSLANAELDRKGFIAIRRSPYRVCLTEEGRAAAERLIVGIEQAIIGTVMAPNQRNLLSAIIGHSTERKPPGRLTGEASSSDSHQMKPASGQTKR